MCASKACSFQLSIGPSKPLEKLGHGVAFVCFYSPKNTFVDVISKIIEIEDLSGKPALRPQIALLAMYHIHGHVLFPETLTGRTQKTQI